MKERLGVQKQIFSVKNQGLFFFFYQTSPLKQLHLLSSSWQQAPCCHAGRRPPAAPGPQQKTTASEFEIEIELLVF